MIRLRAARRAALLGLALAIALASSCRQAREPAPAAPEGSADERGWRIDAVRPQAPTAPAPEWTHEFAGDPTTVRLDGDGRVFALVADPTSGEARLVALHDGEVRWSTADAFAPLLAIEAGEIVAARRSEIVAYDPASGIVRWSAVMPAHRGEHGEEHPHVRAFVPANGGWIAVDTAGRSFAIAPAACRSGVAKACVRTTGSPTVDHAPPMEDADPKRDAARDLLFSAFKDATDYHALTVDDVHLQQVGRMAVMRFERNIAVFELPLTLAQAAGAP